MNVRRAKEGHPAAKAAPATGAAGGSTTPTKAAFNARPERKALVRFLVMLVTAAIAAMLLTSCPSCATTTAPKDNRAAAKKQIAAAAMYRDAAFEKSAAYALSASGQPNGSPKGCAIARAAHLTALANRAKIEAYIDIEVEGNDTVAAVDYGKIIDGILVGIEVGGNILAGEQKAKAALAPGLSPEHIDAMYYDAQQEWETACGAFDDMLAELCGE